jgi:hypothetical protein
MNARAIALQGLGYGARLVAVQGLFPASGGPGSAGLVFYRGNERRRIS